MTLCVTFERYLVVCWPLRARHLCTVGRAKLAVVVFFLFAVSYNVPRFFELTYRETERKTAPRMHGIYTQYGFYGFILSLYQLESLIALTLGT